MSRFTYDNLLSQQGVLLTAIGQENDNRRALESKISRLEKAISKIEKNLTLVEEVHQNFTKHSIDESSWRGTEKDQFDEQFQSLTTNTKSYVTQTKDAKTAMEDELSKCETSLTQVEGRIASLERSLGNVQSELKERRTARK